MAKQFLKTLPSLLILLVTSSLLLAQTATTSPAQVEKGLQTEVKKSVAAKYLLFLPEGYEQKSDKKWPLMLFLHGAGERGDDLNLVKTHGPPKLVETRPDFPFIVVSPQCPKGQWWSIDVLLALLDQVVEDLNVDEDRIYLTGLSMGGFGTWALAAAVPDRFAAIPPICGGGSRFSARALAKMPTWIFHGVLDTTVPVDESFSMYKALARTRNANLRLTLYPEAKHDSWTETYDNEELYEWFLSHKKSDRQ